MEAAWHGKSRREIEKELLDLYARSLHHIESDIRVLYARFANDNGLDMVEAQRLLMGQEYRTWRMDIEDYIKEIQASGDNELLRELNTLAMRSRITRLDKLYADTLVEIGKLSKDVRAAMDKFLPSAYKDFYYHDLYDIGQKRGLIHPVSRVDAGALENVIRTPWSGKNYSARIWKNGEKLAETIQRTVTAGMHRGCSADELARYVEQRMNVGYSQAIRLVRTELNYVENRAIVDGIKESGMKYYRFVATLDRRTSATCRDHDGHIYPVDDYSPGTNAPPLHPHCRSTIVGSIKGDGKPKGTRAARDESGKYIRVPADMSYEEWKKVYVDKKITVKEWRARGLVDTGIIKDVTKEHLHTKARKAGEITVPQQSFYAKSDHREEIRIGQLLHEKLGGEFQLLTEVNQQHIKTPDYMWNGRYWELKNISSINAANNAIRKGLKQISENPGGLILWINSSDIDMQELLIEIVNRLYRSAAFTTTIIIGHHNEIAKVLRYTKK